MKHRLNAIATLLPLLIASSHAAAQAFIQPDTIPAVVGLGVGFAPDYQGSDDYKGVVAPFAHYTLPNSNRYLQLNATELTFNLVNSPKWRLGPVLNYHPGRDDVHDEAVKRMQKIDGT